MAYRDQERPYTPVNILDENGNPTKYYRITVAIPEENARNCDVSAKDENDTLTRFVAYLNKAGYNVPENLGEYKDEYLRQHKKWFDAGRRPEQKMTWVEIIAKKPESLNEDEFIKDVRRFYAPGQDITYRMPDYALPYFFEPTVGDFVNTDKNGNIPARTLHSPLRGNDKYNTLITENGVVRILNGSGEISPADEHGIYKVDIEDENGNKSATFLSPDGKELTGEDGKRKCFTTDDDLICSVPSQNDYFAMAPYVFNQAGKQKLFPTATGLVTFLEENYPYLVTEELVRASKADTCSIDAKIETLYSKLKSKAITEEKFDKITNYYNSLLDEIENTHDTKTM